MMKDFAEGQGLFLLPKMSVRLCKSGLLLRYASTHGVL